MANPYLQGMPMHEGNMFLADNLNNPATRGYIHERKKLEVSGSMRCMSLLFVRHTVVKGAMALFYRAMFSDYCYTYQSAVYYSSSVLVAVLCFVWAWKLSLLPVCVFFLFAGLTHACRYLSLKNVDVFTNSSSRALLKQIVPAAGEVRRPKEIPLLVPSERLDHVRKSSNRGGSTSKL